MRTKQNTQTSTFGGNYSCGVSLLEVTGEKMNANNDKEGSGEFDPI
jgi:hypothetical protein